MTVRVIVVDTELTHREIDEARIVEWAAVLVEPCWFGISGPIGAVYSLVNPGIPIPPETSAIHHIIDSDVANAPTWDVAQHEIIDFFQDDPEVIAVAHSADTERTMLAPLGLKCRWLCTYKAALRVWPDAPAHSNEALRYWLGFGTGRGSPQAPHSALHDAEVTAKIFEALVQAGAGVKNMIKWTDEPAMLPRCPIGDYRGMKWAEVPSDFLDWILRKIYDRDDLRFCARKELDRREAERQREAEELRAPVHPTTAAAAAEALDEDIPF